MILTFYIDGVGLMFLSFVLAISSAVLLFSGSYMKEDFHLPRFVMMVLLFVMSMSLLITSLNLISLLLGWDGLGVVSYVLVVYYQNEKSNAAGMITAMTNRVGDVAVMLSIGFMVEMGGWNFMYTTEDMMPKEISFLGALIILASITKSAQMPFSAWLPAAMAAPTPVSALVHSSTLVTAGVYLMVRFYPLFTNSKIMELLALVAFLTTLMSSISALSECDLKKIVALSTLSQLGIMVMTISLGLPQLALYHLMTHATFKALLFMCSGKIIHAMGDTQDIRSMGNLVSSLPLTSAFFNLSNLALCGFPFLAGFYSKDMLVEVILMDDLNSMTLCLVAAMVGLSSAYSLRLTILSLLNYPSTSVSFGTSDEDSRVSGAYLMLGILAVSSGAILSWALIPAPHLILLPAPLKILTLGLTLAGVGVGLILAFGLKSYPLGLSEFFMNMWLLPAISGALPTNLGLHSNVKIMVVDLGWAEMWGGAGGHTLLVGLAKLLPKGPLATMFSYQIIGGVVASLLMINMYLDSLISMWRWKCQGVLSKCLKKWIFSNPTCWYFFYKLLSQTNIWSAENFTINSLIGAQCKNITKCSRTLTPPPLPPMKGVLPCWVEMYKYKE
uniref:NADH-ubiquinone oxidoreductase chain 5 n=1 Tax=Proasellus escolai TaxID=1281963 RepID=A0A485M8C9_9CRUS|nr:NADH dehydrogenase subunit 5 [Proasellus escolai]